MPNLSLTVLWIYIVLLLAGGVMGFLKAGSRISLITSSVFALLLALCALGVIKPFYIAEILIGLLVVVFGIRYYTKGRKFMPSGLMLVLSVIVLALLILFYFSFAVADL